MVDHCTLAREISGLLSLQVIDGIQLLLSVLAFILVSYTLHFYVRRSLFDRPFKELIYTHYITIAAQSLFTGLDKIANICENFAADPCNSLLPKPFCLIRVSAMASVAIFVVLHLAMSLKQSLSVLLVSESVQLRVTRPLIACSVLYAIGFALYAFRNEKWTGESAYCNRFDDVDHEYLMNNLYVMFAIDFSNAWWLFGLWMVMKRRIHKEKSFNLEIAFRRQQNLYSMEQFLPIAALHALAYVLFTLFYTITYALRPNLSEGQFLILNNFSNIFPIYCVICPLVLIRLLTRGRKRRQRNMRNMMVPVDNEVYFSSLRQQWDSTPPSTRQEPYTLSILISDTNE